MIQRPNQDEREEALRKYFEIVAEPNITVPMILAVAGLVVSLISLLQYREQSALGEEATAAMFFLVVGLLSAIFGVALLTIKKSEHRAALTATQPQPSDTEVDRWLYDSMQNLLQHSRNILSLIGTEREFVEPLVIRAPTLASTYGIPAEDLKWRKGSDGALRFAIHKIIVIYLTDRHLAAYTCDFNFIRNVPLNEITREYHYQDVISVATYEWSQSFTLPTGQKLSTSQIFRLAVASGESIEVRLDNDQLRNMTKEEAVPTIGAEQAVRTIRAMLREKKMAPAAA